MFWVANSGKSLLWHCPRTGIYVNRVWSNNHFNTGDAVWSEASSVLFSLGQGNRVVIIGWSWRRFLVSGSSWKWFRVSSCGKQIVAAYGCRWSDRESLSQWVASCDSDFVCVRIMLVVPVNRRKPAESPLVTTAWWPEVCRSLGKTSAYSVCDALKKQDLAI